MASHYEYTELSTAVDTQGTFNIYAVVAECSVPRPTRGTDMICNLTLVDPSTPERPDLAAGIEMLCFATHPDQLPHLRSPGDIIRLHRVKVGSYNGKPQLVGKVGPRGAGFAYCIFHAAEQQNVPYQTSSPHYHFDERERQVLAALRAYCAAAHRSHLGGTTTYLRRIKDVRPRDFFDIVCKVVAVDNGGGGSSSGGNGGGNAAACLLFIWDGSDALPFPMAYDTRQQEDMQEPQRQLSSRLQPFALPLASMPNHSSIPLLGTCMPLVFPGVGRVEQLAAGSWVKMRNLGARVVDGQLQAFFHRSSRWMAWPDGQQQQQLMAEYQQRLVANHIAGWAPAAASELLALSRHRQQPYSSLRQVLLDAPAGQPRCYKVLVRLMAYTPHDVAAMCHPARQCDLPDPRGCGWAYTLKLLVEDATAQLDVILFGTDGDTFFAGLPAQDMRADPTAAAALQQRLHWLLGQGCQRDGGPWMEMSIKAYYTDPAAPWQTRQYRVFHTSMQQPLQQQQQQQPPQQQQQQQQPQQRQPQQPAPPPQQHQQQQQQRQPQQPAPPQRQRQQRRQQQGVD